LKIHVAVVLALVSSSAALRGEDPQGMKSLRETVTICGDSDIWSDVTSPTTARAIKGIQWKKVYDTMKDFVADQKKFIETRDQEIISLKAKIAQKEGKATSRKITKEEVEMLVEQAVAEPTSFGSKQAAEATACGKPGFKFQGEKPNPEGYANSIDAMQEKAEAFFTPEVESEVGFFTRTCEDHLGFQRSNDAKADDLASYCDELCAEMAQIAQGVSNNQGYGSKSDVNRLKKELVKAEKQKQALFAQQTECEDATQKIKAFHAYMEQLLGVMRDKHKAFQEAEWNLADAEDALTLLTGNLLAQKAAVEKAKEGLTDLGLAASKANSELQTADAQMQVASETLQKATDQWKQLTADLEAVKAAEKFADEVKEKLSLLLMKMDAYVEECVREPVRNIGLSEETKVYDGEFFTWDVTTLPAKEEMNDALTSFHTYCETIAKGIFEAVKDKVDLSPLCKLQPQDASLTEIADTVQDRKTAVVDAITDVQSWLNPFKGTNGVTEETEQTEYVDEGEPMGLRRVMGLQLKTFYSGYLKKWKRDGEFLQLIASITEAINDLNQKVEKAGDEMAKLDNEMQVAQSQLETAVTASKEATTKANLEKQDLTDALEALEGQVKQANLDLEELRRKVRQAKLAWGIASTMLVTQHAISRESLIEDHAAVKKLE